MSLLANVFLIGGSRQLSKDFLMVWIAWKSFAILIFWGWFGYNQLKHHNYIQGIQNCQFCSLNPESTYIGKLKTIQLADIFHIFNVCNIYLFKLKSSKFASNSNANLVFTLVSKNGYLCKNTHWHNFRYQFIIQ